MDREKMKSFDRRKFLKTTTKGLATAAGVSILMNNSLLAESPPARGPLPAVELEEVEISQLGQQIQKGDTSCRQLVEKYIQRIEAIDRSGPSLHAIIELNPDAFDIARKLDEEIEQKKIRGPLHGIPVLLKDNIDTNDKMKTTAGSLALVDYKTPEDAILVKKLRAAGVLILGKTNLSEWANFRSSYSISGWSSRGGFTRNPYYLDRNPCGSSSGSAVAVSANLCTVAIGTETDGSVICPASINGIVGIKPTLGLISGQGIIPIAHSQDTAGPMARTVRDCALLLGVLANPRGGKVTGNSMDVTKGHDYTKYLKKDGLKGKKIGVVRSFFGFAEKVDPILEEALLTLKEGGAELVDPVVLAEVSSYGDDEFSILLHEFKADLNAYLRQRAKGDRSMSLADIIAFNSDHAEEVMTHFGQDLFIEAEKKAPLTDARYLKSLERAKRLAGKEGIDATLKQYGCDALLGPSNGPAWLTDHINGDHFLGGSSSPAAVSGYPSITVPAGNVAGLPIGISIFSGAFREPLILEIAYAFEQLSQKRIKPAFIPELKRTRYI